MAISRRRFLGATAATAAGAGSRGGQAPGPLTLFLCGDVMLGRGIDQILPHPVDPELREPYVRDARAYVQLAERAHGPIPRDVAPGYVWGDALDVLDSARPAARIVNLETSITESSDFWPGKGINYRMSPRHADVLTAAGIDCCTLANNHVMDFGREGLRETLATLEGIGVAAAGAGTSLQEASAPARLGAGGEGRVLVFGYGLTSSGIPPRWAAGPDAPGVNLLSDLSEATLARVLERAEGARRPGDLLVASIHWGGNWGYEVPEDQVRFAHGLIDGGFDAVHGHSSHHAKAIEIHRDRPILYGAGDFITDYEGISGHEEYRGDIGVAYLPRFSPPPRRLAALRLVPFRVRRFRLERAPAEDVEWLRGVLTRESRPFGTTVEPAEDGTLVAVPA